MHHQFLRLFLSIVLVVMILVIVQIAMVAVGNYQVMANGWKNSVFTEFVESVSKTIQQIGTADISSVVNLATINSSERISGIIIRDKEGNYAASLGVSPSSEKIPTPAAIGRVAVPADSRLQLSYQSEIDYETVKVPNPQYELMIVTADNGGYITSISLRPIAGSRGFTRVKLPEIVTDQDIAGTIAVSVDGESFCYVDVLVYKLGYYAPTAFALKMLIDIFAVSLPTACIAALIFAAIFSRRVAGSTKMILRALDDIANGNYDVELPKQKIVEYGKIAASIRTLASDLERHGRSRKEWIRNISHDLNTPVTALTLLINGIEEGVFQPDEQIIGQLKEQTDILAERIASVNYYSYLLSPDVPVDRVLLNVISVFSEAGIKCNTCFDIDEGSKAVDVWADEKLLMRAAEEILYNAGEYSSGDKKIVIRCFYDKASAVITVRNSGKLPDPRPQFFEPWARGDDSRTSGGSGLGLPIVYQIMELHSGAVSIDEADGFVEVRLVFPLPSSSDES